MPIYTTPIKCNSIASIFDGDPATVEEVVQRAVYQAVCMVDEVIHDGTLGYQTRERLEDTLNSVNATLVGARVGEMLDDFKRAVLEQLSRTEYIARVRKMEYDDAGQLTEVTVKLTF